MADTKLVTGNVLNRMYGNMKEHYFLDEMTDDAVDAMMGIVSSEPEQTWTVELKDASEEAKKANNFSGVFDTIISGGAQYCGVDATVPYGSIIYISATSYGSATFATGPQGYYKMKSTTCNGIFTNSPSNGAPGNGSYIVFNYVAEYLGTSYEVQDTVEPSSKPIEPVYVELKDADENVKLTNQFRLIISANDLERQSSVVALMKSKLNGGEFHLNDIVYLSTEDYEITTGNTRKINKGYYKFIGDESNANYYGWQFGTIGSTDISISTSQTEYLGETYRVNSVTGEPESGEGSVEPEPDPEPEMIELKDADSKIKKANNFGGSYDAIVNLGSVYGGIQARTLVSNGISVPYPETVIIYISEDITSWTYGSSFVVTIDLKKGYYQLNTAPISSGGCATGSSSNLDSGGLVLFTSGTQMDGVTYIGESYKVNPETGEKE